MATTPQGCRAGWQGKDHSKIRSSRTFNGVVVISSRVVRPGLDRLGGSGIGIDGVGHIERRGLMIGCIACVEQPRGHASPQDDAGRQRISAYSASRSLVARAKQQGFVLDGHVEKERKLLGTLSLATPWLKVAGIAACAIDSVATINSA